MTCYTCHRGQPVPANIWFNNPGPVQAAGYAQIPNGKNHPTAVAGYTALPYDPFTPFLEDVERHPRRGHDSAARTDNLASIKQTNWTYSLMFHLSGALGVNCTYCHNTRSFTDWAGSTPQRVTAWYGIRMVRDLNNNYLNPLQPVLPAARLGAHGRRAEGELRNLPPGRLQAAVRCQHGEGFPRTAEGQSVATTLSVSDLRIMSGPVWPAHFLFDWAVQDIALT